MIGTTTREYRVVLRDGVYYGQQIHLGHWNDITDDGILGERLPEPIVCKSAEEARALCESTRLDWIKYYQAKTPIIMRYRAEAKYPGWLKVLVAMTWAVTLWALITALGWWLLVGW